MSTPLPAAPAAPPSPARVAFALALLLGLQPLTTDLYLPTLAQVSDDLHVSPGAVQQTMSAVMFAFGLGQLICGPLSDRYGRRRVLMAGLWTYLLASLGALLAPSLAVLLGMRALQGLGVAASVVCGRATVRDLYEPQEGAHVMSRGLTGLGFIAVCSPAVGGLLGALVGWRGSFAFLSLAAIGYLAWFGLRMPETLRHRDPDALIWHRLWRTWGRIAGNATFWAYASLSAATYGGMFLFLAGSAYVYINVLGQGPLVCGLVVTASSVAYISGTWQCRRWLARHGMAGTAARGALFSLGGGLAMAGLSLAGVQTVAAMVVPQVLYSFAHGVMQPCGQTGAVGPFPREAGAAAALSGFVLAAVGALMGLWLGHSLDGTTRPVALGIGLFSVLNATLAWTLVRRHGVVRPAHA